jgi:hypothetical protein
VDEAMSAAAGVLAQHQADPSTGYCICGGLEYEPGDPDEMTTLAVHQAVALKAAGYAVVQLPQPGELPALVVVENIGVAATREWAGALLAAAADVAERA